jgi:hypothetical protein
MTAALTTKQINHLNHMNRSAQDVSLGTMLGTAGILASGSLTVSDAQANASMIFLALVGSYLMHIDPEAH